MGIVVSAARVQASPQSLQPGPVQTSVKDSAELTNPVQDIRTVQGSSAHSIQ